MSRKKRRKRPGPNTVSKPSNSEILKPWETPSVKDQRGNPVGKLTDRSDVKLYEYELTDEPIFDKEYRKLPRKVQDRVDEIYLLAQEKPAEAVEEILELMSRYPKVSQFYNFLVAAYAAQGDIENRDAAILQCYAKFPKYLFARLNYAQLLLEKNDTDAVPEVFEHKLDLKMMYPRRWTFHVSEFVNFAGIIIWYYHLIGDQFAAREYYKMLKKIAPGNIWTKRSKMMLYPSLKARFATWLLVRVEKINAAEAKRAARLRKLRRRRRRRRP